MSVFIYMYFMQVVESVLWRLTTPVSPGVLEIELCQSKAPRLPKYIKSSTSIVCEVLYIVN